MKLGNGTYKLDPGFDTLSIKGDTFTLTSSYRPDSQKIVFRVDTRYSEREVKAHGVAFEPIFEEKGDLPALPSTIVLREASV